MLCQGSKAEPSMKIVVAIVVPTVVVIAVLLVFGFFFYKRKTIPTGNSVKFVSL